MLFAVKQREERKEDKTNFFFFFLLCRRWVVSVCSSNYVVERDTHFYMSI